MKGQMKIQVLGSGCATCKKLFEIVSKAVAELGLAEEVKYITGTEGMQKIIELGALSSPVITIDNKIAMIGFTPDMNKIKAILQPSETQTQV